MTEEIQQPVEATAVEAVAVVAATPILAGVPEEAQRKRFNKSARPQQRGGGRGGRGNNSRRPGAEVPAESDYEEKNIEVARVTRVTKGGKRMRFRVLSVIGNHKGRAGFGLAKGLDVAAATSKATTKARKSLITLPLVNETIPHAVEAKFAAARIILKPAPRGTGIKAGGPVRSVLELAGVPNVTAKILGSKNKINNVKAVFKALKLLSAPVKANGQTEGPESRSATGQPVAV